MRLTAGVRALEALEPEWARLFGRCTWATPFQHPSWLLAWCRAFAPPEVWTAIVRDRGELLAVAPVFVEERAEGRVAVPIGAAVSDYLDFLAADPPALRTALDALAEGPFAEIDLPRIKRASPLEWVTVRGASFRDAAAVPCPVVTLPQHVDDLEGTVSHALLVSLRKARRRAERDLGLALQTARDVRGAEEGIASLLELHAARWRARGERGVLADPKVQRFHLEAAPLLAQAGLLRVHELRLGADVAAVIYAFHHGGRAYLYLGGFDPAHDRYSTGSLLMLHALEQAIFERLSTFDLLTGREPYKYRWGAVDEPVLSRSFALGPPDAALARGFARV